jgi:hypothetical protein
MFRIFLQKYFYTYIGSFCELAIAVKSSLNIVSILSIKSKMNTSSFHFSNLKLLKLSLKFPF